MENFQIRLKYHVFNELLSYVNWKKISEYQNLSEDFIREFKDKVEWDWIGSFRRFHSISR